MTLEAVTVANVITEDAVIDSEGGASYSFLPPRPKRRMKAMTFGIQATLSYLVG